MSELSKTRPMLNRRTARRLAARCLGMRDGYCPSDDWLIADGIKWLGHEIGNVRISMGAGSVFIVACDDGDYHGCASDESLAVALATIIAEIGMKRGDL